MVAWRIQGMGGVYPRTASHLVGDNQASEAVNCDLATGDLKGLPQAELLIDFSAVVGTVEKAYRFPPDEVGDTVWLLLPSRYSQVVRSPLANDDKHRVYWTNPGDAVPHWNTRERVKAGLPYYDLGTIQPTAAPVITSVTGGDPTVPATDRVYLYTYLNEFGEESSPSPGSNLMSGPPDATWTITFPGAVPVNPVDRAYPAINRVRLYRTITSTGSGAQFYRVTELNLPHAGTYVDTIPDSTAALGEILETVGWGNPPENLDGLVALTGGFLAGFTNNTVHFTEPNRPHTWPSIYDQSVHFDIVTMVAWQQYLMVLTQGFPSAGSGNSPSSYLFVQSQAAIPCVARGSAVVDPSGVLYASQDGLQLFTGYQITNTTTLMVSKEKWLEYYHARDIIAARHRHIYMAINGTDKGFIIDPTETRLGFEDLSTVTGTVCIWNDENTGDLLVMADKRIYLWDNPSQPPQIYRWRSKTFSTPLPISLGAVQLDIGKEIFDVVPANSMLLTKLADNPASGPGPGLLRLYVVDVGGKATLRAQAGIDATAVDIVVNVGSGFATATIDTEGLILSRLSSNPAAGPGIGLFRLYAIDGVGGTAILRAQAGTDPAAVDIAVNIGSGFSTPTVDKSEGVIISKFSANPVAGPGAGLFRLFVVEGAADKATFRAQAGAGAAAVDIAVNIGSGFAGDVGSPPLDSGDVSLPVGVNAQFRYYAGPNLDLIMTRDLTVQQEIFRLPNGFKTFDHQVEITSRVPVSAIQLATTLQELKTV